VSRKSAIRSELDALARETRSRTLCIVGATALLWAVEIADQVMLSGALDRFGVQPRSLAGLPGILASPFLHGGFGHLVANTVPFVLLGILVTSRKTMDFWVVAVASALVSGLGIWLTGAADSVHIGASGVVFGFLGFLMGRGVFERRVGTILLSLAVTFFFGGMLWGVLPFLQPGVSWQGHLFGWLGGLLVARALGKELRKKG